MRNVVLRCDPTDGGGDECKLILSFNELNPGVSVEDALALEDVIGYHTLRTELGGGTPAEYRIYLIRYPVHVGPIFCEEAVWSTPFIVVHEDGSPFHCENCAKNFVSWFMKMQPFWAQDYHTDWHDAHSQRQHSGTHRLS